MSNSTIKAVSTLHDSTLFLRNYGEQLQLALEQGDMPTSKYLLVAVRAAYADMESTTMPTGLYASHILRDMERARQEIPALIETAETMLSKEV